MPALYSERLDAAVALALAAFREHVRKGTNVPYVTHLFTVMSTVGEYGGDEDQLIAAVLHDWLEDIEGARIEALTERFGPRVAGLVAALSDSDTHPKPPWRARKEAYLGRLRAEPPELKLISAADKLHNCASIRRDHAALGPAIWERFAGRQEGTLWYYEAVSDALRAGWSHPLGERLHAEVQALMAEAGMSPAARLPVPAVAAEAAIAEAAAQGVPADEGPRIDTVVCQTGLGRHDPALAAKVSAAGGALSTVECFDKCETCELFLLARVDGAMMRFRSSAELVEAIVQLRAAE
jgi:hypothetical protein